MFLDLDIFRNRKSHTFTLARLPCGAEGYEFGICSDGGGAGDSVGGDAPAGVVVPGGAVVPGGVVAPGGGQLLGALGFSGFTWQLAFAPVDSNRMAW